MLFMPDYIKVTREIDSGNELIVDASANISPDLQSDFRAKGRKILKHSVENAASQSFKPRYSITLDESEDFDTITQDIEEYLKTHEIVFVKGEVIEEDISEDSDYPEMVKAQIEYELPNASL